jgi:hypothetical protein
MDKALRLMGLVTALVLVGCGGGRTTSSTLSGTVATGAPMVGATVEVYSAGLKVGTATTDSTGKYTTTALLGEGPYVIKAVGGDTALFSVQVSADGTSVNVTPLTNLVSTLLSPTGDASKLATEIASDKAIADTSKISDKKALVKKIVMPVADAINLGSDFDVINTKMDADGTGLDQILDNVKITIANDASASTIQVMYKVADMDAEPQIITFSNSDAGSNVIASVNGVQYSSGDIFDKSLTPKLMTWVKRGNECNKLPVAERWTGEIGSKVLQSSICKKLFYNDDPNGIVVNGGLTAEQLFIGTYSSTKYTEDTMLEPEYVYSTAQGEVLVKVKSKYFNEDGSSYFRNYFFNLTPDQNNNNELRFKGNNSKFEATVNSVNYIRYFPYTKGYDNTYSGYEFDIPTTGTRSQVGLPSIPYKDANGNPINVKSAVVTAPNGLVTYLKNTGLAQLVACRNATDTVCSASSRRIVRSTFFNPATGNPEVPPDVNTALNRTRPAQYITAGFLDFDTNFGQMSDQDIRKLPMMGTFKFELTMSDNSTTTQRVPFFGRPKTHKEILKTKKAGSLPSFTTAFLESIVPDDYDNFNVLPVKSKSEPTIPAPFKFTWDGIAQFIYMSGFTSDWSTSSPPTLASFEMRTDLAPDERSKTITCLKYSGADPCFNNSTEYNFNQNDSRKYTIFSYMEIGNYFSDFGVNFSAYGFWDVKNDALNQPVN